MKKKAFPKFGNGKGMKKSIPIIRERESEAFILGNGREREFPLTPATILGTDLDSATHKLRVSDEKQDSHPKLEAKSPLESLPPVWDTFCQVDFSYT